MAALRKPKERSNPQNPEPICEWTDKKTRRHFTTVTVRQEDDTFVCVLADYPEIRETGRTADEATGAILEYMANPANDPKADAEDIREAMKVLHDPKTKWLSREQFLRSMGREDLLLRKRRGR